MITKSPLYVNIRGFFRPKMLELSMRKFRIKKYLKIGKSFKSKKIKMIFKKI